MTATPEMVARTAATPRRLRVVYLGHSAAMSGAEISLLHLLGALNAVEPHVILAENGPLVSELEAIDIPVEVLPLEPRANSTSRMALNGRSIPLSAAAAMSRYALRLAAELQRRRPDLVHTNSMKAHLYGGVACRLARIPQVWHARDRLAADYMPVAATRVVRGAARLLPTTVVANSQSTLATYGRHRSARVVYNPIPPQPRRRTEPDGPFTVGVVGRLAKWKGQDVFLRAFADAFAKGDERARIVGTNMFGEHQYADSLRQLAESLGIAERVTFAGFRADVAAELGQLHTLVHCSTVAEPFGRVVIEGMAAALPVIATNAGGPAEIINDDIDGRLVPAGDVAALASALRQLAHDPQLRSRLGARARQSSAAFTPDVVATEIDQAYRAVLRQAQPGHHATAGRVAEGHWQ